MNETEARKEIDDLAETRRYARRLNEMVSVLSTKDTCRLSDGYSKTCEIMAGPFRDAIKLCLQMEAQRVDSSIKEFEERIANWK